MDTSDTSTKLNLNRVVSYNLKRARGRAGMTQEQAAAAIEPYLGRRVANTNISMMESAATSVKREVRQFDAADIAAFARAFDLPIAWFFMPPRLFRGEDGEPMSEIPFNWADERGIEVADLVDSLVTPRASMDERIEEALPMGNSGYRGLAEELDRRSRRAKTEKETES
jgi:hypothetical protein